MMLADLAVALKMWNRMLFDVANSRMARAAKVMTSLRTINLHKYIHTISMRYSREAQSAYSLKIKLKEYNIT